MPQQPHWNDVEVEEQKFTTWRNPTSMEIRVDIFDGPGRRKRLVFKPGEEHRVPAEYDRAIHDVRDGVTVGGLAPLLERAAGNTPLHPSLEPASPPEAPSKPERKPVVAVADQAGAAERPAKR